MLKDDSKVHTIYISDITAGTLVVTLVSIVGNDRKDASCYHFHLCIECASTPFNPDRMDLKLLSPSGEVKFYRLRAKEKLMVLK